MSDDVYNTQPPPEPNPVPFQQGPVAEGLKKFHTNTNMNGTSPQPNYPPPPPPPHQPGYHYYQQQYPPYPPQQPVMYMQPQQQSGCFGFLLRGLATVAVMLVCFFVLLLGGLFCIGIGIGALSELGDEGTINFHSAGKSKLTEQFIAGNAEAKNKIAVITIDGIIANGTDDFNDFIVKQIKQVQDDRHVVAVVLRINSPGGTISGSDYYHNLLQKMKDDKSVPVIVSMGAIAASGGYYVAMAGDEIYAEATTITGSIGVIVSLFNAAELCQKIGVESTPITSGPLKSMGTIMRPMTEDEKRVWQNLVDDSFTRFKDVIKLGREEFAKNPDTLDKLATGQIYTANEAVANKLIDKIGFIDDAIEAARDQAGVSERDCKVIRYKKKTGIMEILTEANSSGNLLDGKTLSEKTTPKVYAICPYVLP